MPLRALPEVGRRVQIDYIGSTVGGTVTHVQNDRRRVEVETEDGATVTFELNCATATFTVDGSQTGARLRFVPD